MKAYFYRISDQDLNHDFNITMESLFPKREARPSHYDMTRGDDDDDDDERFPRIRSPNYIIHIITSYIATEL